MGNNLMQTDLSVWGMYQHADIVVKCVMIGLILASVVTWAIFFSKSVEFFNQKRRLKREQQLLAEARSLNQANDIAADFGSKSLSLHLLNEAQNELELSEGSDDNEGIKERTSFRLERRVAAVGRQMGRGNGYLATIGAISPFVGLFGTVWGIMNSFIGIAQTQTTNLAVVAPGIAEALLATAIGLVAAIPAVVIYNVFARQIGGFKAMLGDVAAQVLLLQSRDLDLEASAAAHPVRVAQKLRAGSYPMAMHLNENLDDNGEMHDINVTPFIDVMLVLLIIFMVAAPLATVDVKVNLPASTSTPQPRPEKPVYLSVKADNSMFIGNDPVTDETMITALNALTEGKKDTTIFFRADKTVDYETLMKVMDTLHQAGYLKIGLVGEETAKAK